MNWEENRELGVVRLHIFNSRISNSRKIPGPKKRELGGHTVYMNKLRTMIRSLSVLMNEGKTEMAQNKSSKLQHFEVI